MRSKKPKLSKIELRLLEYPPKRDTWICKNHTPEAINGGNFKKCYICGSEESDEPKLWERYLVACTKIGILPESGRVIQSDRGFLFFPKNGKKWEPLEPTTETVEEVKSLPRKKIQRKRS